MSITKRNSSPEGYNWVCKRSCTHTCSVRASSFIEKYKTKMKVIFKVMYKYIAGVSFVDIAYELGINRETASGIADLDSEIICDYISNESVI